MKIGLRLESGILSFRWGAGLGGGEEGEMVEE